MCPGRSIALSIMASNRTRPVKSRVEAELWPVHAVDTAESDVPHNGVMFHERNQIPLYTPCDSFYMKFKTDKTNQSVSGEVVTLERDRKGALALLLFSFLTGN